MRFHTRLFLAILITFTLFTSVVSADWAYNFVVNKGKIFVISEEEHVDLNQVGSQIGKVTKYSDREGTYSGNFSNRYPKGTAYYEIIGVDKNTAIAIKVDDGLYVKAIYSGEYAGRRNSWIDYLPGSFVVLLILYNSYLLIIKKINR